MRLFIEELKQNLKQAEETVVTGATYRHYKGHNYRVAGLAIWEATNEIVVIYEALYVEDMKFVRPVNEWTEEIKYEGRRVRRFTRV